MNNQLQMIGQSQILQSHQNYVVWSPYPPENPVMFACLPPFNTPPLPPMPSVIPPSQVKWKRNRKKFSRSYPIRSGPSHMSINHNDSQPPVTKRSGYKGRQFHHPKRKFSSGGSDKLLTPLAPHNTTSFIMRTKKSGGIASLVSPCPATPTILPTPNLSPSREVVVEMAKEKWGVDGYGSMKGLIRLRSEKENFEEDGGTGGSDNEEVERRLDQYLSKFELICPNFDDEQTLKNRLDKQDTRITHLKEENFTLRERIFLVERELNELRRHVACLETHVIGSREPEIFHDDIARDVYSEQSVGNDHNNDVDDNINGDSV